LLVLSLPAFLSLLGFVGNGLIIFVTVRSK
jgi:hypothetical protein